MNEYIYKSFNDKFESYKQREQLVNNIRYFNDIDYANMDPTNIGQHLELSYVKNIYDNSEIIEIIEIIFSDNLYNV